MIPGIEFWLSLLAQIAFFLLISLTLNLQYGLTGIPNFGLLVGVGGGGLAAALLDRLFPQWILGIKGDQLQDNTAITIVVNNHILQHPIFGVYLFVIICLVATLVGCLTGILASLPAIRLRGDYLVIILFALGFLVEEVGNSDFYIVNGSDGISLPDPFVALGPNRFLAVTLIAVAVCVCFILYLQRVMRSPLGRTLRAIRDNDTAAVSIGRNLITYRLKAMGVGSAIAGLGGALYVFYTAGASGGTFNRFDWLFYPWLILILGGRGNNLGAVLGASVVMTIRGLLNYYQGALAPYLPFNIVYLQYFALGIVLVVIMIYRPQGLLPERPGTTIRNKEKPG